MVNGCANSALRQVARVFHEGTLTGLSDRQILEHFVAHRDETAFEALLSRHGPMVLNVCRQLLRDPHDAEDAFQAVFLVLVRKASSLRLHDSLGPWLYTVAGRVAARARANRRRMRARESTGGGLPESPADDNRDRLEDAGVIHEELGRLPERLRAPLVLCYLEGLTHDLAARQLDCPVGTVRSRLSRARGVLQQRMSRRGLAFSATVLGSAYGSNARAGALPSHVRMSLIKAVNQWTSGSAIEGGIGISTSVATLLKGVLNVIRIKKLAMFAMGAISVGAVIFVAAVVGRTQPPNEIARIQQTDFRSLGPDGRPIGAATSNPNYSRYVKTYYVGDVVRMDPFKGPVPTPSTGTQPMVEVTPIIELITSTVAPGTWQVGDGLGHEISSNIVGGRRGQTKPVGSITPFFLSISLIIQCTPEAHKEIASLLRRLRNVIESRDRQGANTARPAAPPAPPKPSRSDAPQPAGPAGSESRPRVRQLLDELRQEIDKLDRDHR
ncbi:MAG: RNA polymerase sigma factor [Isosphaerales bacterium]